MILAGNILWFIFGGGFFAWIGWLLSGIILCCTVVGILFGIACFLSFILIFPIFFGVAHFKLVKICFALPGKKPVSSY